MSLNACCIWPTSRPHYSSRLRADTGGLSSKYFRSPAQWMSQISDDTFISALNIPGSHESMASVSYLGLSIPICQRWSLAEQLNAGIRFIDIRVKEDEEGRFPLYHGVAFQKSYLEDDVVNVAVKFLELNPSETIILMIRIERQDETRVSLNEGFASITSRVNPSLFSFDNDIPRLSSLRGKIWVWCGYNWEYNQGGFMMKQHEKMLSLVRQDEFLAGVEEKKNFVRTTNSNADKASQMRQDGKTLYLNQLNSFKWNVWPASFANHLNLFTFQNKLYNGIIAIDFPGEQLIKEIIETNFITKGKEGGESTVTPPPGEANLKER